LALLYVATGIIEEIITRRKSKVLWGKFQTWCTLKDLKVEDGIEDEEDGNNFDNNSEIRE
jgi:hypothetical protein